MSEPEPEMIGGCSCGETPDLVHMNDGFHGSQWQIVCDGCGLQSPFFWGDQGHAQLIKCWQAMRAAVLGITGDK